MKTDAMANLLAELLESQVESGKYGELSLERIKEALTTGPGLSQQEQSLLLLSPVARADYKQVKSEVHRELKERLEKHDVELKLLPLAAADKSKKVVMHSSGFSVTLIDKQDIGIPWIILVQLGSAYKNAISPMTTLRLVDSGGLEWLREKPDNNGEMTAAWNDPETNLVDRARRFSLILEPI